MGVVVISLLFWALGALYKENNDNIGRQYDLKTFFPCFLPKRNQTEWNWVCVQTWDRTSTSHRHEGRVARQQCHPSQRQQLDHVFLLTELTTHRWNSICFYCFLLLNWPQIYIPDESRNLSTMVLCTSWEVRQRKILPPGFEFFYCRPPQLTREHCSSCSCVLRLFLEFGLDFWVSICHPPRLSFNNFKFCRPTKNFRNKNNNEKQRKDWRCHECDERV